MKLAVIAFLIIANSCAGSQTAATSATTTAAISGSSGSVASTFLRLWGKPFCCCWRCHRLGDSIGVVGTQILLPGCLLMLLNENLNALTAQSQTRSKTQVVAAATFCCINQKYIIFKKASNNIAQS